MNTKSRRRSRYPFVDPKVVMGVAVSLIILSAGVFAFFAVVTETDKPQYELSETTCFTTFTTNPNNLTLPVTTSSIISVIEYFSDDTTNIVDSGNYTWSARNPSHISVNTTTG